MSCAPVCRGELRPGRRARLRKQNMVPPVEIDVVTPLPEGWGLCVTCEAFMAQANLERAPHERSLDSFPPDWQADYVRLSDLIQVLAYKYGERIIIRLVDPRSLQGLAKSIRHGIRRYPTFLVMGREKIVGLEVERLEQVIQGALHAAG